MEVEGDNRNPDAMKVAELQIQYFDESKSIGKKLHFFGKWSELQKSERRKPKRTPKTP
jgi:hypothetical protein